MMLTSLVAVLAILLLVTTFIIACLVMQNFGRGLKTQSEYLSLLQHVPSVLSSVRPSLEEDSGSSTWQVGACPQRPNVDTSKPDEYRIRLLFHASHGLVLIVSVPLSHHLLHYHPRHETLRSNLILNSLCLPPFLTGRSLLSTYRPRSHLSHSHAAYSFTRLNYS